MKEFLEKKTIAIIEEGQREERKKKLNVASLVDEGPQYLSWEPIGIQSDTTEMITCALGRTYGLSMILLSQGIAREIGLSVAVRRNLNTQFIGEQMKRQTPH